MSPYGPILIELPIEWHFNLNEDVRRSRQSRRRLGGAGKKANRIAFPHRPEIV
jgi:hypothetical protein